MSWAIIKAGANKELHSRIPNGWQKQLFVLAYTASQVINKDQDPNLKYEMQTPQLEA